ncbi:MAG: hypothetical protein ABFC84_16565 [Veillonellales bacterium]
MQVITEEDKLQDQWYEEAKKQTVETLPGFIKKLTTEYQHDYGTICHAIAAAAVGAAWAVDHSEQGGITGFQASCINWEFLKQWGRITPPARILSYKEMLYPQKEYVFTTISKETWDWLQKTAKEYLASKTEAHPNVIAHWESIANGKIPFGFSIEE